jgi:hypothetical protein
MDNRALNLAAIRLAKEENVQYLQALTKHIVGSWHPIPSVSALRSSDDWQVFMQLVDWDQTLVDMVRST